MTAIAYTACLLVLMPPEVTATFHIVIFFLTVRYKASYKAYSCTYKAASTIDETFNASFFLPMINSFFCVVV